MSTPPAAASTTTASNANYAAAFVFAGEPRAVAYPHELKLLRNTAYLVAYDESRANPAWAAYRIPGERKYGNLPRPRRFATDSRTYARVAHEDYTNSGYDRGHMTPNLAIASRFGEEAQRETFLMSNIVPQSPALNQGPWRLLEEQLSETTAPSSRDVWVVVGPIYNSSEPERRVNGKAVVPSAFFMVVATQTTRGPMLDAYVMPQTASRNANFRTFRTTVQEVQTTTGLDFYWELPDPLEFKIEGELAPYWLEARADS